MKQEGITVIALIILIALVGLAGGAIVKKQQGNQIFEVPLGTLEP